LGEGWTQHQAKVLAEGNDKIELSESLTSLFSMCNDKDIWCTALRQMVQCF
jgi:hypothetical protein